MATLAVTFTTGAAAAMHALARYLDDLADSMPDQEATGGSTVLTFDNAPTGGQCSVQVTGGPYQSAVRVVSG